MSWFSKFFKKREEFVSVTTDVPISTIKRWYVYDTSFENEAEVAELIGLSPVSDEGHSKERQDSEKRLDTITHLMPYIDLISEVAAESVANLQFNEMRKAGVMDDSNDFEELAIMRMVYQAIAISALVGGLSIATHLGIVSLDAISSEVKEGDNDEQ